MTLKKAEEIALGEELAAKHVVDIQSDTTPSSVNQVDARDKKGFKDCRHYSECYCCYRYGGKVGLVVRELAFHLCDPGSISALGGICGLSLLVLYSAMRGFSPGTPVFPSQQKPTFDLICE